MPAKKKSAAKKEVKKKAAAKKPIEKKKPVKKAKVPKPAPKPAPKPTIPKRIEERPILTSPIVAKPVPAKPAYDPSTYDGPTKECDHCDGTGKCAAGEPYDKGHHQMFGSQIRLTSCPECLVAGGEHHNSKKLVDCRFCVGTGKVPV